MTNYQSEKQAVRAFHKALDAASGEALETVVQQHLAPGHLWRGYHPFGEIADVSQIATRFWAPLKQALRPMQRREDIFFAGSNHMDDCKSTWVVSMGHLMGLFDQPWLNIQPTGKMALLRYCAFYKVQDGVIAETSMYFDIPHLMVQAGQNPFGPQTAAHLVQPGPITHDGLLYDEQPKNEGRKTLAVINKMISDLGQWQSGLPLEEELALTWHDDMIWWGPEGIGASYTIERYAKQHAGPFRASFADRSGTGHIARLAEGNYGGFMGWPNFTARHTGGFMGMPATNEVGEFRVIDIYRRSGDKLAENWIFIDLLHFWKTQGVDILERATKIRPAPAS
ncbi:ester cyclase [Thalassococcus lentus]|uniref:Ester cyclase n=1 Tax=Thalassococcus lentus TaxID=1210524 RepID=A0ABT4XP26_9RHOB|nr:ester cyclase [Thalassococcus lentus]MDA7423694.1 ester cyclase [Thalassococcus lentus]